MKEIAVRRCAFGLSATIGSLARLSKMGSVAAERRYNFSHGREPASARGCKFRPLDLKEFRMSRLFNKCRAASEWNSPPQMRRGGCAVKKKSRSHLSPRRRGGVD